MLFANSMTLALDHCSLGPVEDVNIPSVVFALNLKFNSSQTFFFPFSVEERLNGTLSISRNLASFVCFFFSLSGKWCKEERAPSGNWRVEVQVVLARSPAAHSSPCGPAPSRTEPGTGGWGTLK